jgi:hypothetical protein
VNCDDSIALGIGPQNPYKCWFWRESDLSPYLAGKGKGSRKSLPIQAISIRVFEAWTCLAVHGKNFMRNTIATFWKIESS